MVRPLTSDRIYILSDVNGFGCFKAKYKILIFQNAEKYISRKYQKYARYYLSNISTEIGNMCQQVRTL